MSTIKNYRRSDEDTPEGVEVFTPGRMGIRPDVVADTAAPQKKQRGVLPFAIEEEKPGLQTPPVIEGEPGQADMPEVPLQPAATPKRKPSLLDDIKAELDAPPPPPIKKTTPAPDPAEAEPKPATPVPPIADKPAPTKVQAALPARAPTPAQPVATKEKRKRMSTDPKEQGRVVAQSVVDGFVGALRGQAAKRGGHLSIEDVNALSSSFERQADKLADTFARQLKSFSDARAKSHWTHERVNAFHRIVVKRFSHLLIDEADLATNPERLSRRMLPGLFHAIEMMIGAELLGEFEKEAGRIAGKLRERLGDDFSWDHAYAHRDSKALVLDLLVAMAPHFEELDKRMVWMLELINTDMPGAHPNASMPDWKLDQIGLVRMLDALFVDLRGALEDDLGRLRITKRHGFEVLEALLEAFDTFDKNIADAQKA